MSQTYTKSQYDNMDKRRRIAWAKYYELEGEQANQTNITTFEMSQTTEFKR